MTDYKRLMEQAHYKLSNMKKYNKNNQATVLL